jgi:hypothetical protein
MVISRRVLRRNRLRPRLLGFDSREDLSHPCTTVYALALLVTVEQQRLQPPLSIALPRGPVVFHSRCLPFWSPTTSDPAYGAPLLERRVARIMVGTEDLLELDAHDALSTMRPALGLPHPAPACRQSAGPLARVEGARGVRTPNSRCSHEIGLNPVMACFPCLMAVLIGGSSLIATVDHSTEGATLQHSPDFSIISLRTGR